jgi:hypothetical protein
MEGKKKKRLSGFFNFIFENFVYQPVSVTGFN